MRVLLIFGLAGLLSAQTLQNTGAPIRIPFDCTEEDTREAGLTCSDEEPCPVYLELSGAESLLNHIFAVGNLHTSDATLYSILLASSDAGKSWIEPYPRIRFGALEQIQFIDFENGWIGGALLQGVPRDPFFLITDDGGKTWNKRPIFDDGRAGVVERFWFDSRTSGTLLIDTKLRHELYVTETGGSSWSLQQAGRQPIAFKRAAAAADPSIRLRADSKIHGYRVEKHQGDKWVSAGDFLVEVGKCKN